jgi:hypothetical protein
MQVAIVIRLAFLQIDDQVEDVREPRPASVGTSSLNRIASSSRLLLPVTPGIL